MSTAWNNLLIRWENPANGVRYDLESHPGIKTDTPLFAMVNDVLTTYDSHHAIDPVKLHRIRVKFIALPCNTIRSDWHTILSRFMLIGSASAATGAVPIVQFEYVPSERRNVFFKWFWKDRLNRFPTEEELNATLAIAIIDPKQSVDFVEQSSEFDL